LDGIFMRPFIEVDICIAWMRVLGCEVRCHFSVWVCVL
jgi:hypothetical protein